MTILILFLILGLAIVNMFQQISIQELRSKVMRKLPKIDKIETLISPSETKAPPTLIETMKAPQEMVMAVLKAKAESPSARFKETITYDDRIVKAEIKECQKSEAVTTAKDLQNTIYSKCKTKKRVINPSKAKGLSKAAKKMVEKQLTGR
jgi:hypothetical protein